MEKPITVEIYPSTIEEMLVGIEVMCNGLSADAFEWGLRGVFRINEERTEQENAYDFLCQHYDELQGAIRTIGATISILNSAIANDSIRIATKE